MSIPKIIHYCWFGGNPLPKSVEKCIASWKKYCPDYRIVEWNESNFDLTCCAYCEAMLEKKKTNIIVEPVEVNNSDFDVTELHVYLANDKQAEFFKTKKKYKGT